MGEISKPQQLPHQQQGDGNIKGVEPERYKEINQHVFQVMKQSTKDKEIADLMDEVAEITENKDERDVAEFLLGFYYTRIKMSEMIKQISRKR